ncbi:MAG: hypothetical protein AB8B70_08940 [Prochlorococcus sp.]
MGPLKAKARLMQSPMQSLIQKETIQKETMQKETMQSPMALIDHRRHHTNRAAKAQ